MGPFEGLVLKHTKFGDRRFCDQNWEWKQANVLCRGIGYGYAISAVTGLAFQGEEGGRGVIRNKFYNCTGEEKDLFQCKRRFYRHCPSNGTAGVVCSNAGE